jgi:hypothetical protein
MAGFAAQAQLRSQWGDLIDDADVTEGLKSVVGWFKQVFYNF